MPLRKIIRIDESLCDGCGECVSACAEVAIAIVNGKARLVKEQYCDGFGDCIGDCPTGALKIVESESDEFDPQAAKQHLRGTQGEGAVRRMEAAEKRHEMKAHAAAHAAGGGGPGTRMRFAAQPAGAAAPGHALQSDLQQWPVQIHLVQPGAPFFHGRELVVLSTCAPVASADVHWRFIRGRGVAVGCPKLDDTDSYAEKLGAILSDATIPKVIVVRMEVPCCGGLTAIVGQAAALSGRSDLAVDEVTVGIDGNIRPAEPAGGGVR